MGKIGDLWVKLGLKKSEFDKGINDAKKQTSGFTDKIKGVGVKAAAIWAAVGAGLVTLADKFAHTSQRFGDLWDNAMSRMKTAWNAFLSSLTNWDWSNFGNKIKNAMDAAGKSQSAHDADFEVQNSISIRKGQMQEELAQLQILMRDTKLSYEQRAKYAQQYLDKVKPLYEAEIAQRQRVRDADLNEYLAKAGVSVNANNRAALETFFTDVAPNETLLNALDQYSKRNSGKNYKLTQSDMQAVDNFLSQYDYRTGAALATLAEYYQGSSDEDAKKAVDAITALYSAKAAFNEETRRIQTIQNTATAQIDNSSIDTSSMQLSPEPLNAAQSAVDALNAALLAGGSALEEWSNGALDASEIDAVLEEAMEELQASLDEDIQQQFEEQLNGILDEMEEAAERARQLSEDFANAVTAGFSAGCQELADQLFGLKEVNAGAIFAALLTPIADMAMKEGEILIAEGIGVEACKAALESLNGYAAIAAGAALVAIGAAAKAGLQSLAGNGGRSTSTTTYNGASSTGNQTQLIETEMTIYVKGEIDGSNILLSGSRTEKDLNR